MGKLSEESQVESKTSFCAMLGEVERIADFVAVISRGKLLTVDRLGELKAQTRHLPVTRDLEMIVAPEYHGHQISREPRERQAAFIPTAQESRISARQMLDASRNSAQDVEK